jgi:hypothetical protein
LNNNPIEYITEEAIKELEKYSILFRNEILAYAILIAIEEGVIEVNQSHVTKAYKKVLRLKRLEESKNQMVHTCIIRHPIIICFLANISNHQLTTNLHINTTTNNSYLMGHRLLLYF